jgi:hypothetical protein
MGFVFIEANVKKWGLAPMTGSLAPPPPYGSEQGSILLEAGREGANTASQRHEHGHSRSRSGITRIGFPTSPGPQRSPTDISLSHLVHIPSNEDPGEGASSYGRDGNLEDDAGPSDSQQPPEYTSPEGSQKSGQEEGDEASRVRRGGHHPPIPSYDAAVGYARYSDFNHDTHER